MIIFKKELLNIMASSVLRVSKFVLEYFAELVPRIPSISSGVYPLEESTIQIVSVLELHVLVDVPKHLAYRSLLRYLLSHTLYESLVVD